MPKAQKVSPEDAASIVKSGDRVILPLVCGEPQTLIEALVAQRDRLKNVEIVSGLLLDYKFLKEGMEDSFHFRTWQAAPVIRHLLGKTVHYMPIRQGDVPRLFSRSGPYPVDVAFIHVSPPDKQGYCSLGVSISHSLPTAVQAKTVIAEVNERMPRVLGNSFINLSQIDYFVESSRSLLEWPPTRDIGEKEKTIGRYVAELIPDGATLQIGIGGIPEATAQSLGDKRDLRFYAMGVDTIVDLVEQGVVERARDADQCKVKVCEILGTQKLFDFVDNNPVVYGCPTDECINSLAAASIDKFVSIISAMEVDLSGQVNAETIGGKQFSAIGGSHDFLQGAYHSNGGKSIIALTSTAGSGERMISRIVGQLPPGSAVTHPRHSVQYVVTEYGVADLRGKTLEERAEALITIAHPDFQEQLRGER